MMYFLVNFKHQISHRCFISWKNLKRFQSFDRTFYNSILFYIEINKLSNFDSFVFAIFVSMYNFLRHWKSLFENFKQYIVEKITSLKKLHRWKNHIVEKITSLKKSHRWKSFKICIVEKICTKILNWIR